LEFGALVNSLLVPTPRGHRDLVEQLRRAAASVVLNIAEGAGEFSCKEKPSLLPHRAAFRGGVRRCRRLVRHERCSPVISSKRVTRYSTLSWPCSRSSSLATQISSR